MEPHNSPPSSATPAGTRVNSLVSPGEQLGGVYWSVMDLDDGELYRKHAHHLVALATTLVGPNAAADVVAAAVTRTITSPAWPHVTDRLAYWVRAVSNEARSSYRSEMRRAAREAIVAHRYGRVSEDVPDPVDPTVLAAIASLSIRQRAVVYLAYWCDLSIADIALTLDLSEGTVRRHLARARSMLRRKLT